MGHRQVRIDRDREVEGYGWLFAGKTYTLDEETARGLDGKPTPAPERPEEATVTGQMETAAVAPPENAAARTGRLEPKHVGGGWYEVGGEKVQGKAAAAARARELTGE